MLVISVCVFGVDVRRWVLVWCTRCRWRNIIAMYWSPLESWLPWRWCTPLFRRGRGRSAPAGLLLTLSRCWSSSCLRVETWQVRCSSSFLARQCGGSFSSRFACLSCWFRWMSGLFFLSFLLFVFHFSACCYFFLLLAEAMLRNKDTLLYTFILYIYPHCSFLLLAAGLVTFCLNAHKKRT